LFRKKIEFGNYTLKFGEDKVLLDKFSEIVMPSFAEGKYIQEYHGNTEYFFLNTEVIKLNDSSTQPEYAIKGKLVKNTTLKRFQIFEDGALVNDKKELASAPSSSFLLILSNHRLIFTKEVPSAPTIKNFETVSSSFLQKRYNEYIEEEFQKNKKNKNKITKIKLIYETPKPSLRVTSLTDNESLSDFILRFEKINKVSVKLLSTNNEDLNLDDFWNDIDERGKEVNSLTTKLEFINNTGSLKSSEVFNQVSSAVAHGNTDVMMNGVDNEGALIKGNNDTFKLVSEIKSYDENIESIEKIQYSEFQKLVTGNIIKVPQITNSIYKRLQELFA
jgi:hypothetical protein